MMTMMPAPRARSSAWPSANFIAIATARPRRVAARQVVNGAPAEPSLAPSTDKAAIAIR